MTDLNILVRGEITNRLLLPKLEFFDLGNSIVFVINFNTDELLLWKFIMHAENGKRDVVIFFLSSSLRKLKYSNAILP